VLDPIASTIAMGCREDQSFYFNGVIDEVRVYSRALSDAEIATLAQP
jgi:concanavalin A-like lectin/glucanase superfamily protein